MWEITSTGETSQAKIQIYSEVDFFSDFFLIALTTSLTPLLIHLVSKANNYIKLQSFVYFKILVRNLSEDNGEAIGEI